VRNILRLARPGAEPLEETDYRLKMLAVFSDPGFAMVGLSEQEACERGAVFLSASYPFADHGKAMVGGCTEGFVKLIVDARSRVSSN
jgi:pyruvate/2-oxoglutarate dehydrogenase complex dihydrolipoamide dehydrogenase (E3) component